MSYFWQLTYSKIFDSKLYKDIMGYIYIYVCVCVWIYIYIYIYVSVVIQLLSPVWLFETPYTSLLCPPLSPGICSNSCPLSQWCYLTISSYAAPSPFAFNLTLHIYIHTLCAHTYIYIYYIYTYTHSHIYTAYTYTYIYTAYIYTHICIFKHTHIIWSFPGDSEGRESTCNVGDPGSIPAMGRSPG